MQSRVLIAVLAVIFALHCALATRTLEAPASTLCAFSGACARGDWVRLQKSAADDVHPIIIAVSMRADAEAACDALLMEISTPGSPKAGLRYTHEQVGQLLSNFDNTRTVEQWLRAHDLAYETASNGDFIRVSAPVARLERLLGAQFHDFSSKALGLTVRRTASISIPENVRPPSHACSSRLDVDHVLLDQCRTIFLKLTIDGTATWSDYVKMFCSANVYSLNVC